MSYCDQVHECTCSNAMVSRYQKRISGPLLDRIDIHIEVPRVEAGWEAGRKVVGRAAGRRVDRHPDAGGGRPKGSDAWERQRQRFEGHRGLLANADALVKARVGPAEVRDYCQVDDGGRNLLRTAMQQLHMSAQAYNELSWSSPHSQAVADDR